MPSTLDERLWLIPLLCLIVVLFIILILAVLFWKKSKTDLELDLPNTWFWDLTRVSSSYIKYELSEPNFFYQEVRQNSREEEFLNELVGQLDFDLIKIQKAFAIVSPVLASNLSGRRKIQRSRMVVYEDQFCSQSWQKDNPMELRSKTLSHFQQRIWKWSWNKGLTIKDSPVLPVVHGTSEEIGWKIASGGFAALSTLDSGFYGKGIYYSSSGMYTLPYIATRPDPTILICLTIPGNPFPVIEDPKGENSLLGKPIEPGYQSNYVVVKKNGIPFTDQDYESQKSIYDELVIEQEAQVVPIFLLRIDVGNPEKLLAKFKRELFPEQTKPRKKTFISTTLPATETTETTETTEKKRTFLDETKSKDEVLHYVLLQ